MSTGFSQASSRDWLAGNDSVIFSTRHLIESETLSLSGCVLPSAVIIREGSIVLRPLARPESLSEADELSREFNLWDELSDEALLKFEKSL
jgi:hypothetical protein